MYTLQGKTRPTRYTLSTLSPRMTIDHTYLMWSTHNSLLRSRQQICTNPLPPLRRRAPDIIHSSMVVWSAGPYPAFLPQQPMRRWEKRQASVDNQLLDLSDPYHRHAIGTFNTCSRGLTHRSLTNTDEGYNLEGVGFPHTTPRPSQLKVLPFPTKSLTRSLVYPKSIN
jgi:hypothetical protein